MPALDWFGVPEEQSSTPLRLPAAAGMLRGTLVVQLPPPRRHGAAALFDSADVSDARIDEFVAEFRALGGMAVIA